MTDLRLVADIGGTNARFASVSLADRAIAKKASYPLDDYESFHDVLEAYLAGTGSRDYEEVYVAAAGPVENGKIQLTNAPWEICGTDFDDFAGAHIHFLNDLEAVALALPHLGVSDSVPLGPDIKKSRHTAAMLAVNVGTGFGAATAIPREDGDWIAEPSEAGHMALGATSEAEWRIFEKIGKHPLTVEDVLSGAGLRQLYEAVAEESAGASAKPLAPPDIFALSEQDEAAKETVGIFSALLGRISGDLVLATASWGGVYLTGGVIDGWPHGLYANAFRETFEAKAKMTHLMRETATYVITRKDIALLGLAVAG